MDDRIPTHLEVSGLIRAVQSSGGFATVIAKGERDAGALMLLTVERGQNARLYERMPQMDGSRKFVLTREQDLENPNEFNEYLDRRKHQDRDCWILELDVANPERFAALQHKTG